MSYYLLNAILSKIFPKCNKEITNQSTFCQANVCSCMLRSHVSIQEISINKTGMVKPPYLYVTIKVLFEKTIIIRCK